MDQFRKEGGSIGEIPEEKLEFRGRKVVSGMKKTEFRDRRGVRSGISQRLEFRGRKIGIWDEKN